MSNNYDVKKAIRERNTGALLRIFTPTHSLYRINYYTITDNEGNVLARTHEPSNFGDSVLNQQNVKDALSGKVSTYFEAGTAVKVSVRTGAPVYDENGALLGVISAGVRFDSDSAVEELKKLFNAEVTIFSGNVRINTTIKQNGQSVAGTTLDPRIAEIVMEKKREYSGNAEILDVQYETFYKPLVNAQNEVFAIFCLGISRAEIIESANKSVRDGIILGLLGLAVSIIALFIVISTISEPIIKLSEEMDRIANGNLNIVIDVKSDDEVGLLAKSFQKAADTIHKLLDDINIMIAEHEKGNTDYCLSVDEFRGDYKALALSVLKFASFGLRDHLLGIANRRSFDNRLNWEWKRAVSESASIGILIINIDKFKNYNETYGRLQGDAALQTVAKAAQQQLKSSYFIARRDGDELIVLLPSTDSDGALTTAETIRRDVEKALIPCAKLGGVKVTVSIGVSVQSPTQGKLVENFVLMADNALGKAKEAGRNKVVILDL
jgi:diguanylate cyclase (GGDEF)-like protein